MEEFFTKQGQDEGLHMPLVDFDGNETEHWIVIYGMDSDVYKKAEIKCKRELMLIQKQSDDDRKDKVILKTERQLIASLIKEWSFPEPCDEEHKLKFVTNAPHIAEGIQTKAADRLAFIQKK